MIDVVNKFNMVDMGDIDIVESQGVAVEGLFSRLLSAIQSCRYQILYNWKFAEVEIAPSLVELVFDGEKVSINEAITVTEDDVVHVHSLEPEPVVPVIEPLTVIENGAYTAPAGIDGYSPITVNVVPVIEPLTVSANGIYEAPEGVDGFSPVTVEVPYNHPQSTLRSGAAYFELSNWLYVDEDFDFIYKNVSNPSSDGLWPALLTSAPNPASAGTAYLYVQYNFYSGRRVMNIRHGGVWSGDGAYSYDSPYDYDNFYKLSKRGSEFTLYKGTDVDSLSNVAFTATLGESTSPAPSSLKILYTNSTFSVIIHSFVGYSDGDIIHNYVAHKHGYLIDAADGTIIRPSGTGTTYTLL